MFVTGILYLERLFILKLVPETVFFFFFWVSVNVQWGPSQWEKIHYADNVLSHWLRLLRHTCICSKDMGPAPPWWHVTDGIISLKVYELMIFALILVLMNQSSHNFAHVTTAELSWHVQKCDLIESYFFHIRATCIFTRPGFKAHIPFAK